MLLSAFASLVYVLLLLRRLDLRLEVFVFFLYCQHSVSPPLPLLSLPIPLLLPLVSSKFCHLYQVPDSLLLFLLLWLLLIGEVAEEDARLCFSELEIECFVHSPEWQVR
jgi:hypothetical protein